MFFKLFFLIYCLLYLILYSIGVKFIKIICKAFISKLLPTNYLNLHNLQTRRLQTLEDFKN